MSAKAPAFLNKPNHKGNVVATSRGWVVEETGELLVSVKNLDQRIAEHLGLPFVQLANCLAPADALAPVSAVITTEVFNQPTELKSIADVDALLDSLTVTPTLPAVVEEVVVPVVEEVKVEVPEVVKPRRGRPPKVRPEVAAS